MDILNYLKTYQPVAYKIFEKALEKDAFSHAYLFVGQAGAPLLEVAEYIARSILQNNKTFYKYDDSLEKKIMVGALSNYKVIDGRTSSNIKIESIRDLESSFSTTSQDKFYKKIYIINLIENMKDNVANTLLKFVEEPPSDTYAFFTTENEFKVLPTIKSRTQIIKFNPLKREDVLNLIEKDGSIDYFDGFLLSYFSSDLSKYYDILEDKSYKQAKTAALTFIENLNNLDKLYLEMDKCFITAKKDTPTVRLFFDILIVLFENALEYKASKKSLLKDKTYLLENIIQYVNNIEQALLLLMNLREELNYNINVNLLLTNLITEISKL